MKTKDIVITGVLIAVAAVLSMIKISPIGSVALDSMPAFLALYLFRDNKGAIIAFFGHIFSASMAGFPFGIPVHLVLALIMGLILFFGKIILVKLDKLMPEIPAEIIVSVLMFIANVFIAPLSVFISMPFTIQMYKVTVAALWFATLVNLIVAFLIAVPLKKVVDRNV